jgi:hypothetical protein
MVIVVYRWDREAVFDLMAEDKGIGVFYNAGLLEPGVLAHWVR